MRAQMAARLMPSFCERSAPETPPVWAERKQPSRTDKLKLDRASLFGGVYYNRRSAERADDVLFPLFWNLRDLEHKTRTTIAGPLVST